MKKSYRYALVGLSAIAALAALWVALWFAVGPNIPPKTKLLGVDVSKLAIDQAIQKVSIDRKEEITGDVPLLIEKREYSLPAEKSGFTVDLGRSLDAIEKRTWNPVALFTLFFSSKSVEPIIKTNSEAFDRAIRVIEGRVNLAPRNADITYDGLKPKLIKSREGKAINRKVALAQISKEWLRSSPINIPLKTKSPKVSNLEAEQLLPFAQTATSAPLSITLNIEKPRTILISPQIISQALTFVPSRDDKLEAKWLKGTFINLVGKQWTANVIEPVNASFTMVDGAPRVQPSRDGLDVPEAKLSSAIIAVLSETGSLRQVTFTPEPVAAEITTEMAGGLGIKEVIGTFTTFFPYAEYRLTNIHRAARWMDGVIIKPGEVFSYNKSVGERTEARGFVPGIMIDRGVFKKDWGGGVSQVATTTWNAAWFSGLELIQHKPHSFYISRYPAGRESTVAWPNVDVKFRNNSGKPIFVDTSFTNKSVTVTIYGTKFIDVDTESGPRTNPVPFKILESDSKECIFQEGVPGFTIEVWRVLSRDGVEVKREKYRTRYRAEDRIICTNPEATWMNPPLSVQRSQGN
jgi:vancomycin resistance protein YoaR